MSDPHGRVGPDAVFEAGGQATQYNAPHGSITVHHGSGSAVLRRPWLAPPQQAGLVARPELTGRLIDLVCAPHTEPVAVTGLHGTGGFGKTTTVVWLCHQPRVRQRFPGGLLWVTIGEHASGAEVAARVNDLVGQLTGTRSTFTDPQQAGLYLGQLLDTQPEPVLLVVDDVWAEHQLDPFRYGGARCRRLVTTRNQWILPSDAARVPVDRMNPDEAARLLTRDLHDPPADLVDAILAATGRWPVLLGLANRTAVKAVSYGTTTTGALRHIAEQLAEEGPVAFDIDDPHRRDRAVAATIRAGLDLLPTAVGDRFAEVAVFTDDVDIPFAELHLLWAATGQLTPAGVRRTCDALAELSLVLNYRPDPGSIRLHDIIRAYLIHTYNPADLAALHGLLLDAAALVSADHPGDAPAWWRLPDTYTYLGAHLVEHLHAADRHSQLTGLVTDLRWVETRLQRYGPAAVEADLAHTDSPVTAELARAIRQDAHVLGPITPPHSLGAVLASRLADTAVLAPLVEAYTPHLQLPRLASRWPMPDQPHPALRRTLTGHTSSIKALAVSPDGTWLATASHDRTVRIWDPATGTCRHTLTGHTEWVTAVAVSPDGTWLATASHDDTVRIWDPATGTCQHTLPGHTSSMTAVAVSPDGTWLATTSHDDTVRIWDPTTGTCQHTLTGHAYSITAVAISPDGTWLATTSHDQTVRIWDPTTGTCQHTLTDHTYSITAVAISPDGTWLATTSHDQTVRIWDPTTGTCQHTLTDHTYSITAVAISPDGTWLATTSHDQTVRIWDPTTGTCQHTLTDHTNRITALAISPDGTWLATASHDDTVRIWDPTTGTCQHTLTGHTGWITALAISPDGTWLATASHDSTVRIWNPAVTNQQTLTGHTEWVTAVAVSPDGTWLATASADSTVRVWDPETSNCQQTLTGHTSSITALAVSPDGTWLATTSHDQTVRIWDPTTGTCQHTLTDHTNRITALAISPDGTWLATTSHDQTVRIWDPTTGTCQHTLTDHTNRITAVAISPDGTWLATASHDRTVRIWDRATGTCQRTLTGHTEWVTAVAVSPDGTWLGTASDDRTVRIWDPATGTCRHTLTDHTNRTTAVAVSPDGTWLAITSHDQTVRIWDPTTGICRHTLTGHINSITATVVSPDGTWLATSSSDGSVRVWEVASGQQVAAMRVNSELHCCAWLPDGSAVCVAGTGGGLYFFDLLVA
ncbi:NB-ARC domain-containing protein [Plantactinospora sp. CA-290183]|uniref:NB-ARC domain-containing protein n=1 Tax=Plantactinospora sp. CA-290183 TaxID=3240006 RepID=UPI003D929CC6